MKKYLYKDKEFTFKPYNLKLLKEQGGLIKRFGELEAEALLTLRGKFPTQFALMDEYDRKIDTYKKAYMTCPKEDETEKKRIGDLLEKTLDDYEFDGTVKIVRELVDKNRQGIIIDLISDMSIIKPFAETVLIGDVKSIDWEDIDVAGFISEVLVDFFSLSRQNKNESES